MSYAPGPFFPDAPLTLRDGRTATVRPIQTSDAPFLRALTRAVVQAGDGVVMGASDLPADDDSVAERIRERTSGEATNRLTLTAWLDEHMVAEASVHRLNLSLIRHTALLDIQVHPDVQELGLGRALMQRLIDWAAHFDDDPVLRLELYVRADNTRARRLYESLGFEVEGIRRAFVRLPDGTFVDDIVMGRLLDRGVSDR